MDKKKNVIALSGSIREKSTQKNLIAAMETLARDLFTISLFDSLSDVPHFNPDLDTEHPPEPVSLFRRRLKEADGILICTPEYAMGVPGTLKNAVDWTVSSCEFSLKPTALNTASSLGEKGHTSLMETLKIIQADVRDETQLVIPFIKTKVSHDGTITDAKTLADVKKLLGAFAALINSH